MSAIRSTSLLLALLSAATGAYAQNDNGGGPPTDELPAATQASLRAYPGLRAHTIDGRVAALYGKPMTRGASPLAAEAAFWTNHADALGVANLNLEATSAHALNNGKFTVFHYEQRMAGLPVEYGTGRLLVLNGDPDKVVYVGGRVVSEPEAGFEPNLVAPGAAVLVASGLPDYQHLTDWSEPQLVVFAGSPEDGSFGNSTPVRTWKFTGQHPAPQAYENYTFFVDAATGELLHVRNEVHFGDVTGTVGGYATPIGTCGSTPCSRPDVADNPPSLQPMPTILVSVVGGGSAYTDASGDFTIPHAGTDPVTVTVSVADGGWVSVDNAGGDELALSQVVTPGTPATFTFNPGPHSPNSEDTAQVNAFIYVNKIHDFFTSRLPGWTGLDYQLLATTNSTAKTCNAGFTGHSLLFYAPGDGCVNTAYGSIIAHEYGHFIVHQLGLSQHAFGEGFGDACSILVLDDPVFGREMCPDPSDCHLPRDYSHGADEAEYPCNRTQAHECGKVLAGLWRDIREQLSVTYGGPYPDAEALGIAQDLFTDWSQITNGGVATLSPDGSEVWYQSAHLLTLIEILTVDDDDGDLSNGTPHCVWICGAAEDHGLDCADPDCNSDPSPSPPGTNYIVSFQPLQIWYSSAHNGVDPFGVDVADLNGDGLNDAVLACEGSDNILVYLGESSSPSSYTFQAPTAYSLGAGSEPAKLALRHMSLDSQAPDEWLDIVVTLQGLDGVQILLNLGDGTFDPNDPAKSRFEAVTDGSGAAIHNPIGLAVRDWDHSGRLDIAVAGYQLDGGFERPTLGVLWATGSGTFSRWGRQLSAHWGRGYDLHGWTQDAAIPKLGQLPPVTLRRLAMTEDQSPFPKLTIFNYSGPQNFNVFQSIDAFQSRAVTSALLNDDDLVDLAAACYTGTHAPYVQWFEQLPDTTFSAHADLQELTGVGANPGGIDSALLSKSDTQPPQLDGRVDLAVACDAGGRINVLLNAGVVVDGKPRLFEREPIANSPNPNDVTSARQVLVVDINADELPDIVIANQGTSGADASEGFSLLLNRVE